MLTFLGAVTTSGAAVGHVGPIAADDSRRGSMFDRLLLSMENVLGVASRLPAVSELDHAGVAVATAEHCSMTSRYFSHAAAR